MFLCRPAVSNLENSLSMKITSHESSKQADSFLVWNDFKTKKLFEFYVQFLL